MYDQKSNLGSILVAVLAIALILGGVFLLNQSFSGNKSRDLSASSSSSTGLAIGRSSSVSSLLRSTSQSQLGITESLTSVSSSSDSSSSKSSSTSSAKSTSSSSSAKNTTLEEGEFIAKAITPTAKGSNWEIIDCNVEEVFFCKEGFKFPFSTNGTIGKTYKFSGGEVIDSKDGLSVSGINPALMD